MPVTRSLALSVFVFHAGCLLAPDRPGGGGMEEPCAFRATTANFAATIVVPDPNSAGSLLVRAGTWDGAATVAVFEPGASFRSSCPSQLIQLSPPTATVVAIAQRKPDEFAVLVDVDGQSSWAVVSAPRRSSSALATISTPPIAKVPYTRSAFVAVHPMTLDVLFGVDSSLWIALTGSAPVDAVKLTWTADPEVFYGAGAVTQSNFTSWGLVGGRAEHVVHLTGQTLTFDTGSTSYDGESTPCQTNGTACAARIARSGQGQRLPGTVAFSTDTDGNYSILTDQPPGTAGMSMRQPLGEFLQPGDGSSYQLLDVDVVALETIYTPVLLRRGPTGTTAASRQLVLANRSVPPPTIDVSATGDTLAIGEFLANGQTQALVLGNDPFALVESCTEITGPNANEPCP